MAQAFPLRLVVTLTSLLAIQAEGQVLAKPDTVVVQHGTLELRALLWRPAGRGPFPAVLFNHGSGRGIQATSGDRDEHTFEWQAAVLAPAFVRHGYVFLYLFRRGTGLSADQGTSSSDRWDKELATNGEAARNRLQLQLLETDELGDALAGLSFLRTLPEVDARRVAVAGHSFGGQISLLLAQRDRTLRAAVVFAGAAGSWPRSPALRERLFGAVAGTTAPVFFIYAANDYSTAPGEALAAEMERLGKPHHLKIYPPVGRSAPEGHGFVHLRVAAWEPDVFAFLSEQMRPPA